MSLTWIIIFLSCGIYHIYPNIIKKPLPNSLSEKYGGCIVISHEVKHFLHRGDFFFLKTEL